jgi:hypothetical protein
MVVSTSQNVIGAIPVVSVLPPPEGNAAAQVNYTLTPTLPAISASYQLSSQAGLNMSQVITLVIDNSANLYPISIVHGVLFETTIVPAGGKVIAPTFSNKSSYPISIQTSGSVAPAVNLTVNVIFLNYFRAAANVGSNIQSSPLVSGLNSTAIYTGIIRITANGDYTFTATPPYNFVIDTLDFAAEVGTTGSSAPGECTALVQLMVNGLFPIAQILPTLNTTETDFQFGMAQYSAPVTKSLPFGLITPRGQPLYLAVTLFTGYNALYVRVNISGWVTP